MWEISCVSLRNSVQITFKAFSLLFLNISMNIGVN